MAIPTITKAITDPRNATANDVAGLCGISLMTLHTLTQSGDIPRKSNKKYDLQEAVRAYVRYVHHGKTKKGEAEATNTLRYEQHRKLKLENDIKEGRYILREDAKNIALELATATVTAVEALPGRYASELAGISDPALIREKILFEVRRLRKKLFEKVNKLANIQAPVDDEAVSDALVIEEAEEEKPAKKKKAATKKKAKAKAKTKKKVARKK